MTLRHKVAAFMDSRHMLDGCGTVVAAVSGGADSTAMLHILSLICAERGCGLVCAHFNHMLRGKDSDEDEDFVRELSGRLNLAFVSERQDVLAAGGNLEESARRLRYSFLERVASAYPAARIATAHTMNDNAETILFNMARGAGMKGMQGIPPVRESIIRPLLGIQRCEIESYLESVGLSYRTDRTNADTAYSRNRIRHVILPELCRINSGAVEHISRIGEIISDESVAADERAEQIYAAAVRGDALCAASLRELAPALRYRVLRRFLLERTGRIYDRTHMEKVDDLVLRGRTGSRTQLHGDVFARLQYGLLYASASEAPQPEHQPVAVQPGCAVRFSAFRITLAVEPQACPNPRNSLDYTKLCEPLYIRALRAGDRFAMAPRMSKPVRRLYTDRKLPTAERAGNPMLESNGQIAWIMGIGPADGFKPDKTTELYMNIYIKKESSNEGKYRTGSYIRTGSER